MESALQKREEEKQHQAEIRKQIEALQSQLKDPPEDDSPYLSPKRKANTPTVLAPATPSPRKRRKIQLQDNDNARAITRTTTTLPRLSLEPLSSNKPNPPAPTFQKPAESSFLSKLSSIRKTKHTEEDTVQTDTIRTTSFTDKPPARDERLAIIEDFEPGPIEHKAPFDDPLFDKIEPNSGIRLSSRTLSHEDLQDYLRGRYYLSPSRLYSSIRLTNDKQSYDVPVPGDWVTIAVVAERGPLKHTSAPVTVTKDDEDTKPKYGNKGKEKEKEKPRGKKYINIKLIDFGSRSKSSSSGHKSVITGDAFLSLLLFEADSYDVVTYADSDRKEKIYKGGSRGAFEAMSKLKEGDVVALLNPRVLKPFQRSTDTPHPITNILAITPESAGSITTIGRSQDLGMCSATRKDGTICGSWCDKRISHVCDYHIQAAIQRSKATRGALAGGTSGASKKTKSEYDPLRKTGLHPSSHPSNPNQFDSHATYVFAGHIARGTASSDPFFSDTHGREKQTVAQRKMAEREMEKTLKKLAERDKESVNAIIKARGAIEKGRGKGKGKEKDFSLGDEEEEKQVARRSNASFQLMKMTGFDSLAGKGSDKRGDVQKKLDQLASIHRARKDSVPGPRQKYPHSAVRPPPSAAPPPEPSKEDILIDLDSD